MYNSEIPAKPMAPTNDDQMRWDHTALRRRLIQGTWENDLERELARHLPADRRAAWGPADLSSNVLENVTRQLSMLYNELPTITHNEFDVQPLVGRDGLITKAGLYPMMQSVQQMTLALRECIVRIDLPQKGLIYRVVTPDFVYLEADQDKPDVPNYYQELRLRYDTDRNKYEWVADCIDIRGIPKFALYRVNDDGSLGDDVTEKYLGIPALYGDDFPYRDKQGNPFLPLVIYRAEKTGQLWNAYMQSQLTLGSLSAATLWSFFLHVCKNASWPQRYGVGVMLNGLTQQDQNSASRRSSVSTDPSSILMFSSDPDTQGQPLMGQFQAGADPLKLLEAVSKYEVRVATAAGISGDILRQSGDPRSGYAISVSRSGQREISKKFSPIFQMVDELLLSKTAMMVNRFLGTDWPEDGYRIQYAQIPLSPEEMKAQRQDIIEKLNASLISPVQAIQMLNHDLSVDEAKEELIRIRRERTEFI